MTKTTKVTKELFAECGFSVRRVFAGEKHSFFTSKHGMNACGPSTIGEDGFLFEAFGGDITFFIPDAIVEVMRDGLEILPEDIHLHCEEKWIIKEVKMAKVNGEKVRRIKTLHETVLVKEPKPPKRISNGERAKERALTLMKHDKDMERIANAIFKKDTKLPLVNPDGTPRDVTDKTSIFVPTNWAGTK